MYVPTMVPEDPARIPAYLANELQALAQSMLQAQPFLMLQTLHVEPVRPREGMLVKADGTDWDPGSGAGVYCYRAGWTHLG